MPAGSGTAISTTSEFTIESGDYVKLGYVFGNYKETSLSGYKYHDLNADGDRDAEDVGLGGWTINLYKDGVFVKSVVTADGTTDANGDGTIDANDVGYYAFTGLAPGNYTTAEAQQAGWSQSGFSTAETLTSARGILTATTSATIRRAKSPARSISITTQTVATALATC